MSRPNRSPESATEEYAILEANDAFYAAFRTSDFDSMDELWARRHNVAVYHPGWRGIDGRDAVMASWYRIMFVGESPEVFPSEPTVIVNGTSAVVFCTEDVGDSRVIASNIFVREDGAWRICHHQAAGLPD